MIKKISLCIGLASLSFNAVAISLGEAVQHSVSSNPELLFNRAKSLSSAQAIDVARGAYFPEVNLTGGIGREKTESPTTRAIDGSNSTTLNRKETNIELVQNVYSGGAIVGEVERNRYIYEAQRFKTLGVANDLALETSDKFFNVMLHERLYAIALSNLEEHEYLLGMIEERSTAGVSRKAELEQAQSRLALAKANKISAYANLREARIGYAKVVGTWPKHLEWPKVPTISQMHWSLKKSIQKGLDFHPTLKSAYADVKEAKAQYKVAKAAYLPKLDMILSASRNRNLDGLIGPNDDNLAMLRVSYNVFRGGSDQAKIRETAYQVQESYETKNRSIIELKETLRLSWNAWLNAGERLQPLGDHVSSARKTRAAYKEQFKVGKRSLLDLLDSQNEYYQSQLDYEKGKTDEVYSRYRILNGMGTLTSFLHTRIPINVVNNDVLTSHERVNHVLLNGDIGAVPYPDVTENNLLMVNNPVKKHHPSMDNHHIKETTMPLMPVTAFRWVIVAGSFKQPGNANALTARLKGYGMTAYTNHASDWYSVHVGPYEYRGQAGKTMKRIKLKTGIDGYVKKITQQVTPPPVLDNNRKKVTSPNYLTRTKPTKVLQTTNQPGVVQRDPVPTVYGASRIEPIFPAKSTKKVSLGKRLASLLPSIGSKSKQVKAKPTKETVVVTTVAKKETKVTQPQEQWYAVAGSFKNEGNAKTLSNSLEKNGLKVGYKLTPDSHLYRVMVGPFADKSLAQSQLPSLQDKANIRGFVVKQQA